MGVPDADVERLYEELGPVLLGSNSLDESNLLDTSRRPVPLRR